MIKEEIYVHYQECISNFNSAWCVVCELENFSENKVLYNAAYKMALVEYCIPYKNSFGSDKSRLKLTTPLLNEKQKNIHNNIIRLRDTLLAHSDINAKEAKVYKDQTSTPIYSTNIETNWPSIPEFKELLESTLSHFYNELNNYAV